MGRKVKLIVAIDAELLDDTWTERDLVENAAFYVQALIGDGERRRAQRFPDEAAAYRLDADATVYMADDFVADLADWATACS